MSRICVLGVLLILSAEDLRELQLSVWPILALGLAGLLRAIWTAVGIQPFPGIFLLLISRVSGEAVGEGDGWLLLALGMWMTLSQILFVLTLGSLFCAVCAVAAGRKEMPFVPFLTAAYVVEGVLGL